MGWMSGLALIAQLAEHIHGKDEVISSILIEGWNNLCRVILLDFSRKNPNVCASFFMDRTPCLGNKIKTGLYLILKEVNYGEQKNSGGTNSAAVQ